MNNQVTYPFAFQINLLIFHKPYEFKNLFYVFKIPFLKKIKATTVSSITRQILVCNMES